jgi:hypothetical protein
MASFEAKNPLNTSRINDEPCNRRKHSQSGSVQKANSRLQLPALLPTKSHQQQKPPLPKLTTWRECRTELGMSRPIVRLNDPVALPEKL